MLCDRYVVLRYVLDGRADAMWIYADQADHYKEGCDNADESARSKMGWNCTTGESVAAVIVLILHQALLFLLNPQLILSHQPQHPLLFLLLLR